MSGLVSRARSRNREEVSVRAWTNCAIALVKQLWSGNLDDSLLDAARVGREVFSWPVASWNSHGVSVSAGLREKVRSAVLNRPKDFPSGAAAIRRQLGMESPCLSQKNLAGNCQNQKIPKRGDIWPASIEDIAMPP